MLDERKATEILKELSRPDVVAHCEAVKEESLKLAEKLRKRHPELNINKKLVVVGALLHDIGRSKTNDINHAIIGAGIIRDLCINDSWTEKVVRICERHIGGGITRSEAKKLGLPDGEYVPQTLEEKIVSYCDNLIEDSTGKPIVHSPDWAVAQYEKKHGKDSEPTLMVKRLNEFFDSLLS